MKSNLRRSDSTLFHGTETHLHHHVPISWSAVFSGAFIALGLGFILQLFSLAIGLSAYHSSASGTTVAMGGFLALLLGTIASMGIAGFVSGFLGRFCCYNHGESYIYGFLTWSIALLFSALLMLPLSHYASSYKSVLSPHVFVSKDLPKHLEVSQATSLKTTDETSLQTKEPVKDTTTEVSITPSMLKSSSWMIFLLFFLGAASSCLGASCGMSCAKKHRYIKTESTL